MLDRTWYNTLVDDNGTNTTGSNWNKAAVDALMDAIDAQFSDGLWTPVDGSGAGLTLTVTAPYCTYARCGPLVMIDAAVVFPSTANGAIAQIGGLPYPCSGQKAGSIGYNTWAANDLRIWFNAANGLGFTNNSGTFLTNAQMSNKQVVFSFGYRTP